MVMVKSHPQIDADYIDVGAGVHIGERVTIRAEKVVIGDHAYIGRDTTILVPEFRLGHYSKLHEHGFLYGDKPLRIGRNCWIGGHVTLDSLGGLDIDDGVGIGAGSQIWTHLKFGDIVEGCRFNTTKYMHLQKDAWFVGHCLVSPVEVGERSMAMLGSTVTRDMLPNHIYGGVPAVDLTDKLGTQFEPLTAEQKAARLWELIDQFTADRPAFRHQLTVVTCKADMQRDMTCFDVSRRIYHRTNSEAEVAFLKAHVPLVKFTAENEGSFIFD